MTLSESNAKTLLIAVHEDIDEYTDNAISNIFGQGDNALTYPPDVKLSADEIEALNKLFATDKLKSALKKIISDTSAAIIFNLLNNIDGTSNPKHSSDDWIGVKLVDEEPDPNDDNIADFLHDEFYATYWDWQTIKTKK